MSNSQTINNAMQQAVTIQKYFRAYEARKKYAIQNLDESMQTLYEASIIGNDPYIKNALNEYKTEEKVAFIAVSSMRIVEIACQITNNSKNIPKIIIMDNSSKVCEFWRRIRDFLKKNSESAESFFKDLPEFLNNNRKLFPEKNIDSISQNINPDTFFQCDKIVIFNPNAANYFKYLFKTYSFEKVKKIILSTTIICQSWEDTKTLANVKNILDHIGIEKIYMYPSNLVGGFFEAERQMKILENIEKVSPFITLHTDCIVQNITFLPTGNFITGHPENFYVVKEQDPVNVFNTIYKKANALIDEKLNQALLEVHGQSKLTAILNLINQGVSINRLLSYSKLQLNDLKLLLESDADINIKKALLNIVISNLDRVKNNERSQLFEIAKILIKAMASISGISKPDILEKNTELFSYWDDSSKNINIKLDSAFFQIKQNDLEKVYNTENIPGVKPDKLNCSI